MERQYIWMALCVFIYEFCPHLIMFEPYCSTTTNGPSIISCWLMSKRSVYWVLWIKRQKPQNSNPLYFSRLNVSIGTYSFNSKLLAVAMFLATPDSHEIMYAMHIPSKHNNANSLTYINLYLIFLIVITNSQRVFCSSM